MNSFYYTESWKKFYDIRDDWIYYRKHVPVLGKFLKSLKCACMSFTIVDTNYSLIENIFESKSYKMRVDVQDCPEELKEKLVQKGFQCKENGTIIIDLQASEEELWQNVKKEARKLIRRTSEDGYRVKICDSERDFKKYYELLKKSRKDMDFSTTPYSFMKKQWDTMHPDNYNVFIVVDKDEDILAGMGVLFSEDYML